MNLIKPPGDPHFGRGVGAADLDSEFDVLHDDGVLTIVRVGSSYMGELYASSIDDVDIDTTASPLGLELLDVEESEPGQYTLAFGLSQQGRFIERTLNDLSNDHPELGCIARKHDHRGNKPHDRAFLGRILGPASCTAASFAVAAADLVWSVI